MLARLFQIFVLAIVFNSPLFSQPSGGATVRGTVPEKTGAVISKAKITITQSDTESPLYN